MWGRPREGSCVTREAGDTSHWLMPYNPVGVAHTHTPSGNHCTPAVTSVWRGPLWDGMSPGFCGHTGKSLPQRGSDAKKPQG